MQQINCYSVLRYYMAQDAVGAFSGLAQVW